MAESTSTLMLDESKPVVRMDWKQEQIEENPEVVGSVVEFAFGPNENSYLATSYPYRAEKASVKDIRKVAKHNLPSSVLKKIAHLQPRYIMNLAFRPNSETWFVFCYGSRTAYDSKWEPRKPRDSLGEILAVWRKEARDQISSCAFGEHADTWFMRSTDPLTEWYPDHGPRVSPEFKVAFRKAFKDLVPKEKRNKEKVLHTKLRAVTFGRRGAWIIYGKDDFQWSEKGLPQALVRALELGHHNRVDRNQCKSEHDWTINKVVLNPRNRREYVLIYDQGPVYCSFHSDFQVPFKEILAEWSEAMKRCGRYDDHDFEPDYHWEDPSDAVFAEGEEDSDGDEIELITTQDHLASSPRSQPRPTRSGDGDALPFRPRQYSDLSQKTRQQDLGRDGIARQQPRDSFGTEPARVFSRDSGSDLGDVNEVQRKNESLQIQNQELHEQILQLRHDAQVKELERADIGRQTAYGPSLHTQGPAATQFQHATRTLPQPSAPMPIPPEQLQQLAIMIAQQQQPQQQRTQPQTLLGPQTLPMTRSLSQGLPELADNQTPLLTAEQWIAVNAVINRQKPADQPDDISVRNQPTSSLKRGFFGSKGGQKKRL